jgi:hypothetical protein
MSKNKKIEYIPLDPNNEVDLITITAIQKHERINFEAYKELVKAGQLTVYAKLKHPRKIFFDVETEMFCYYCPYHRRLRRCASWKDELQE